MPGNWVVLWACFGFMPILSLVLGIDKHRKYACVGLAIVLVFIIQDHIAGQKLNQRRLSSYCKEMEELENKLDKYEAQNSDTLTPPGAPGDLN